MKVKFNNKYFKWGLTAFLVLAAAIVFYYFIFNSNNIRAGFNTVVDILMPVVLGIGIAYLLTPVLNFTEKRILIPICNKCRIKETPRRNSFIRGIGVIVTAFLFVALIYALIRMLISQIVPSIENIVLNFDTYTNNITRWINKTLEDNPEISANIIKTVDSFSDQLEHWLDGLVSNTVGLIKTVSISVLNIIGVLWDLVIGFIISIYVLSSKEKFAAQAKKLSYALFETDTANIIIRNFRFTHRTFISFLSGKVLDSFIIGIICFICTSLMKLPYAALISLIIGVTNIIPFFGPFLGAVPSTFLLFIVDPMHPINCVYFIIFILVLQQFDGNILGPKILENSTGLAGFWVIFSITLFGGLWGVLGMIVGVPIMAVFFAAVRSILNSRLERKNLPQDLGEYQNLDFVDEEGFHKCQPLQQKKKKNSEGWTIKYPKNKNAQSPEKEQDDPEE